jgi:capsular polysaccharide biosynthesis protein
MPPQTCKVDQSLQKSISKRVTIISRKSYIRWKGDSKFQRILENEEEMVSTLQNASIKLNIEVEVVRLEQMDMCEQIRKAAQSDVLVGVHGAGLVHLWWMWTENPTLVEIEPKSQVGNPSFRNRNCLRQSSSQTTLNCGNYKTMTILL